MKTRTVDFNWDIKSLDDKPVGNAGEILGFHIGQSNEGDTLKLFGWATAFYKGESVVLDQSDFKKLREWVDNCKSLVIIAKGQILAYLDSVKYENE